MTSLLNAVTKLASLLPPSKVEAIAARIREMEGSAQAPSLYQLIGTPAAQGYLDLLLAEWSSSGLPSDVVAGMLLGATHAHLQARREINLELVWTGPTTPFVATRRTEQVLLDLIRGARNELFIVSFVAYDVPSVVAAINSAIDRGVEARILVEASSVQGGSLSVDPVAMMRNALSSAFIYVWTDRPHPFGTGRVHAKVAVADGNVAFLTSANLTGHALEKNMEAGVLITGGDIPVRLNGHLNALIETQVIRPV